MNNTMYRYFIILFLLMLVSEKLLSFSMVERDTTQKECNLYFRLSSSKIEPNYRDNSANISELNRLLSESLISKENSKEQSRKLISISLLGSSSIEGSFSYNLVLAQKRANAVKEYILNNYPTINKNIFNISYSVIGWNSVVAVINDSINVPAQEQAIEILNKDIPIIKKIEELEMLKDGEFWRYIRENVLWRDRGAVSVLLLEEPLDLDQPQNFTTLSDEYSVQELKSTPTEEPQFNPKTINNYASIVATSLNDIPLLGYKVIPLLALKTNLLFDAATILNVELEVPIKMRWSIAGEWIFPWWTNCNGKENSKRNRTQLLNGNLDVKYWFGNREERRVLTGWFAGAYVGGGIYDLERKGSGYQGEFFIAAGLSGGYAHPICKNLSMEYALGIGYLQTHYRHYKACWGVDERWHPVRKNSSTFTWVGPTKAKVSLVWLINHKVRKGGLYEKF